MPHQPHKPIAADRPLRIGLFTDTYLPQVNGVAISLVLLAGQLRAQGHTVFVIAPHFAGYHDDDPGVVRLPAVRCLKSPPFDLALPVTPRAARRLHQMKLDVVHAHTPLTLELLACLAARLAGRPLVTTYHTSIADYTHYLRYLGDIRPVQRLARELSALSCNVCDQVVTPSAKFEQLLRAQGVHQPIKVVPNGIDLDRFQAGGPRGAFRRRLGLTDEDLLLLSLGRLEAEKSLEFVIEAFARLAARQPHACLVIAGDGSSRPTLEALAARSGVGQRIRFTGMLARNEVPSLLHDADLFLMASTTETQSLAVVEAIASGLPVVAVRDEVWQGMLADGVNGWLPPKDLCAFSLALDCVLSDVEMRRAFGQASIGLSQKFSIQAQAAAMSELYMRVLADAPTRPLSRHAPSGIRTAAGQHSP